MWDSAPGATRSRFAVDPFPADFLSEALGESHQCGLGSSGLGRRVPSIPANDDDATAAIQRSHSWVEEVVERPQAGDALDVGGVEDHAVYPAVLWL